MRATGNTGLANRPRSCQCIFDRLLAERSIAARDAKREREAADLDEPDTADLARGDVEHGPTLSSVVGNDAVDNALIEGALIGRQVFHHHPREALKRTARIRVTMRERVAVLRDEGFGEGVDLAGHLACSGLRCDT